MMDAADMPKRLPKYCFEEDRPSGIRIRLRAPNRPKVTLHGVPWSEPFMEAYRRALDTVAPEQTAHGPVVGSWEWLCRKFFASIDFKMSQRTGKQLSAGHVLQRRRALEKTFEEPLSPGSIDVFGEMPIAMMAPKAVKVLRDRLAATPDMANKRLKAVRQALAFAVSESLLKHNAAREVSGFQIITDGFYTWTEEDVAVFERTYAPGTRERRALAMLLYAGPRCIDVVKFGRQMLYKPVKTDRTQLASRWLKFMPHKGENVTGKVIDIPVLPVLLAELERAPKDSLLYIENRYGRDFSAKGFGNWFKDACTSAGLPQCSAHGLRKAGATILAELGATPHQLMAIYGWSSVKEAERYTKKAQGKKLAEAGLRLMSAPK
ncbi:MAG TPA: tyrosine-type recombinase/integrase [Rhizomicrobium sp.]|jgi:site-specific recombinase XerD|nr:tyrosine-type recombinase/integrase [Rhizomicrobium sp.]